MKREKSLKRLGRSLPKSRLLLARDNEAVPEKESPYKFNQAGGDLHRFAFEEDRIMNREIKSLMQAAADFESSGGAARSSGDETAAEANLRQALALAVEAADRAAKNEGGELLLAVLQTTVRLALRCGETLQARQRLEDAVLASPSITKSEEWDQFIHVEAWSDEWLIAAVRSESPDMTALDVLTARYWKEVFGRCYMLTLNRDKASDLAQQAWARVLRARGRLLPGGNFPAYLAAVATNLWRDSQRWSRRAGPVAEQNLVSLDEPILIGDGESILIADALPSPNSLDAAERALLKLDIDQALHRLSPKLREILIARFITGESCAEIAKRHRRTEQTVSGWVREGIQQMKSYLEDRIHAESPFNHVCRRADHGQRL
jgi:RNA polymerase sigma factor (sigma-70 family)